MLDAMFQWNVPGMHNMRQIGYSNREGKKAMEIVKKDHGFSYSKNMTNCEGFHWIISWSINLLFLKRAAHSHLLLSNLIWRRKDIYWSIDILNIDKTVPMHLLSIYSWYKHIFYIYRYIYSSELRGLRSMKISIKTRRYSPYFWKTKPHVFNL